MPSLARTLRPLALAAALAIAATTPAAAQLPLPPATPAPDATVDAPDAAALPSSAAGDAAEAPLGSWRCVRRAADGGQASELALEIRAEGRWADRSGPRAVVARYEWDPAARTLQLLSAGGAPLHTLRVEKKKLVGDGVSCERAK